MSDRPAMAPGRARRRQLRRNVPRLLILASLVVAPAATGAVPRPGPRPISAAERAAVALAADYLQGGAEAWWPHLSTGSPLARLGREAAIEEIELRAGSPGDARWRLRTLPDRLAAGSAVFTIDFPSGVDECLVLDLREERDGWKIVSLRMSAEPPGGWSESSQRPAGDGGDRSRPAAVPGSWQRFGRIGGGALAVLAVLLLISRKPKPALTLAALGGTVLVVSLVLDPRIFSAASTGDESDESDRGGAASVFGDDLGRLHRLRRATTGSGEAEPGPGLAGADRPATRVARAWEAQRYLAELDLEGVDSVLRGLPSPAPIPRFELIRARLQTLRRRAAEVALAYERVLETGVRHDGVILEAADALEAMGYDQRALELLEKLRKLGSREAETWYRSARWAVRDRLLERAAGYFSIAWQLEPLRRETLLSSPMLAYLLDDHLPLRRRLRLDSPDEPVVGCPGLSRRALDLPADVRSVVVGRLLVLRFGEAELRIPGGCELAPAWSEGLDARTWFLRREEGLLEALPALLGESRSDLTGRWLARAEATAETLARRGRWEEVAVLTEGLGDRLTEAAGGPAPNRLLRLRAESLLVLGRKEEAAGLLIHLARPAEQAGPSEVDPTTLYELAELLVSEGRYDPALRLIRRANEAMPYQANDQRLLQVQIERKADRSSLHYQSRHFEILYPQRQNLFLIRRIADFLEAERRRLMKWIPLPSDKVTRVFLLGESDFKLSSGRLGILGRADGKIRVPLPLELRQAPTASTITTKELRTYTYYSAEQDIPLTYSWIEKNQQTVVTGQPDLPWASLPDSAAISVITRELAQVMVAEATGGRAPAWFRDGLAGHVRMVQTAKNPVGGAGQPERFLAFPLIEPALGSSSTPHLLITAHDEAVWAVHFIASRFGYRKIPEMVRAFADGASTEEAISKVLGISVREFDRRLWAWCREAPDFWSPDLIEKP